MSKEFLSIWNRQFSLFSSMSYKAYAKSCQKGVFDQEDFLQESAICVIKCLQKYGSDCPTPLLVTVVKNRFGSILHSQYLQQKISFSMPENIPEPLEILNLTPYFLLSQNLSPLAQQVLWLLVDPPDSLWERLLLQETAKISRKIIADHLGIAPQRISEAIKELKEALTFESSL